MNQLHALWETAKAALEDYHDAAKEIGCATELDTGQTRCCESRCAISTDYVLDRATLERLIIGPVDVGSDHAGGVTITLHPEDRMLVELIVHADLTDPRGVMDARLNRLRVAILELLDAHKNWNGLGPAIAKIEAAFYSSIIS